MFKSLTYKAYNYKTRKYIYDLEDTDFGEVEIEIVTDAALVAIVGVAIAREYSKRNLNVGKNLAIFVLWCSEKYKDTIGQTCEWQDKYCPRYINNWKDYIPGRNEWVNKLATLQ